MLSRQRACLMTLSGLLSMGLLGSAYAQDPGAIESATTSGESRIRLGFKIAPVKLNLKGLNRAQVGLGSYIVNAQAGCSDCHTYPAFAPGGDPFLGESEKINKAQYLTGGHEFGPFTSANLTPDKHGRPAGLTFTEFKTLMRTGVDPDGPRDPLPPLLQVMPWPIYAKMSDQDLHAVYEYLRAIPSRPDNPNPGS